MQAEELTLRLQEISIKYADLMLYLMIQGEPIVPMISDTEAAVFVYVPYPKDIEGEESRLLRLFIFLRSAHGNLAFSTVKYTFSHLF